MSSPKFSILLPTYNRAQVLATAILSAQAQTFCDFELLIVGDGCTDESADVVAAFAKKDQRIRWFDLPKAPGFGYANRNLALREARGELVAFLAHDDLWFPDHLEICNRVMEDPEVDLVHSRPLWVTGDGSIVPVSFNLEEPSIRRDFLARRYFAIPASAIVHRRDCFSRVGYWNEELERNGDWDMWARIVEYDSPPRCRFISEPTCLHFHALWKDPNAETLEHLRTWKYFYNGLGSELPEVLLLKHLISTPIQHHVWHLIQHQTEYFVARLRRAVVQVIDRRIMDVDMLLHTIPVKHRELGALADEFRNLVRCSKAEKPTGLPELD